MRWSVLIRRTSAAMAAQRRAILSASVFAGLLTVPLGQSVVIGQTVVSPGTVPVADFSTQGEPALRALPAAGGTFVDAVFQTPIMRLTDGNDGTDCRVEYSYWPTFNANSTRAKALCVISGVNRTRIWTFNPTTFARGTSTLMPMQLQSTDPIWSAFDPDVVFGHSMNHLLLAYHVPTQTTTTIKDFSSAVPSGGQLNQMSMSLDDDVFAFHTTNSSGAAVGYLVWKRSTNAILLTRTESNIDEVQIDKTGRYLSVGYMSGYNRIWDLQTMTFTDLTWGVDGYFHHDAGRGTILTYNGRTNGFGYRNLSIPHTITSLLLAQTDNKTAHMSMRADNEQWGLISHYNDDGSGVASPFENEIFQVATDGSGKVRRIVHHRSVFNDYYDAPFANISRDGRFVAFSSNWGNANGRRDVFVAFIVPAGGGTPPAPPTNVRVITGGR
jgi:WD40 repeat protein